MVKAIFVVENGYAADELARAMGFRLQRGNSDYRVTYAGESVMGLRTDSIVISRDLYQRLTNPEPDMRSRYLHTWWQDCVLCRLGPGGRVVLT